MDLIIRTPDILEAAKILAGALLGRLPRAEATTPALPAGTPAQLPPSSTQTVQPAATGAPVPTGWPLTQEQYAASQQAAQFAMGMPAQHQAAAAAPQQYAQQAQPGVPTFNPQAAAPAAQAPAGAVPTQAAPTYTIDQLTFAAQPLMDAGRFADLQNLLARFNVQSLLQLPPAQYGAFAAGLRELGAKI